MVVIMKIKTIFAHVSIRLRTFRDHIVATIFENVF
jgi:hypothetical protein